jgi:hypothetical protein
MPVPTMSDQKKPITQATYPDRTTGSEVAASVRKGANRWSEDKRSDLFDRGMQVIYGGSGAKAKVRS